MNVSLFFLMLTFCCSGEPNPNVVVFLADDLGWSDLGCYGSTYHETPNLDVLAKQGMRFTVAYSAASLCSPTRASIMTGKHPARVNITDWIPGAGDKGRKLQTPQDIHNLPLEEVTLGEAFADSGYSTYYAGKWHLGDPDHGPNRQGFQTYIETATRSVAPNGKSNRTRIPIPDGDRWHLTKYITNSTTEFIGSQKAGQPFFAYVAYHDVHTPVLPDDRFVEHFKEKASKLPPTKKPTKEGDGKTRMSQDNPRYASMVRAVDQSVGDILNAIEKAGFSKNTIVVFASDNGGLSTVKNQGPACNLPLRAGKGWLYEGGIRIPLIVKYPGQIPGNSKSDVPVTTTDFYPTLLSLAKLRPRPKQHVDAVDFSRVLLAQSKDLSRTDLFWHFPHYHGSRWTPGAAIRSGEWKLIRFYESDRDELYDLATDPYEKNNIAKNDPVRTAAMIEKLESWQAEVRAQIPIRR